MKVCIIGGVAAGASCAARLRRLDENAEIIMFEKGDFISFANCGLPYHISGVIPEREDLLLQTPLSFRARFNVDVRVKNEVVSVNRDRKTLTVKDLRKESEYTESYDKLLIATGARPFVPDIPGINSERVFPLKEIPDMDSIVSRIKKHGARSAAVIGGGFIGLEAAENIYEAGLDVHIIEMAPQVMMQLDGDLASILHNHIREKGIYLHLSAEPAAIRDEDGHQALTLKDGSSVVCDFAVPAIGVRPESSLARDAGLAVGPRGGIEVNDLMQTSDPDIYAAGDAVETLNIVTGAKGPVPLAGPANKQGRIAADNIAGRRDYYAGAQGAGIVKVFDLQAASTGINSRTASSEGFEFDEVCIHANNHAGYYPGATPISMKVIYEKGSGVILGAQAVGRDGCDKRIDVISTAMRAGLTVYDLSDLDLCYAPPFGSAKDPVNMAGYVACNVRDSLAAFVSWEKLSDVPDYIVIDVRSEEEVEADPLDGALNIPLDKLRERINEIPSGRTPVILCAAGVRSYIAARILSQKGFEGVLVLSGGMMSKV